MKLKLSLVLLFASLLLSAQEHSHDVEIEEFQKELNEEFKNPATSPLNKKEQKKFKGHTFFPTNTLFKVKAKFTRTLNPIPFRMQTTTDRAPVYEKYGEVVFSIKGEEYKLSIFQSHRLRAMEKYKNHLFLPFTDITNGNESYGGGRYLDLTIPETDYITIDFNKAYNPYCAYSVTRSCPIPPKENNLAVRIEAGVKMVKK